jgi:hypothetical protein
MITTLRTALFAVAALCLSATACVGEVPSQLVLGIGESCRASIDCADGLECETEHGQSTCQPHRSRGASDSGSASSSDSGSASSSDSGSRRDGSDDDAASARDASVSPDAPRGALGAACAVDADCAAPLECEVEHGAGTCQPHGRRGGR